MPDGGISDEDLLQCLSVIYTEASVNEAFAGARERFTAKRKDGARRMRGSGAPAAGVLRSVRDLRVRVT